MPRIKIGDTYIASKPDEPLLETLLRANIRIPYGCRQGVCQSCLMRSIDAPPPASAQEGLAISLKNQHHFLACLCHPEQDMTVALPGHTLSASRLKPSENQD